MRAPFHLKVSGSFFDSHNKVDSEKNRRVGSQKDEFYKEEKLRRERELTGALEDSLGWSSFRLDLPFFNLGLALKF